MTRKNLALFDKISNSKKTSSYRDSDDTTTTRSISITASGFDVQARKNGILDPRDSKPPVNLEDIRRRIAKSRQTASPLESVYEDYAYAVRGAANEATMLGETLPLLKTYPREPYTKVLNQAFTGYPKNVGFNNGLSTPQPDFVEGIEMPEYRPFPVDEYIKGAVLYKDDRRSVTLPHIAGEWKGPDGSMAEATLQSSYDGASLVYARNQALAYQGKSDPPGHASVTTFTTNGVQLNFYAHYAAPAEDGTLEYHQYPVKSTSLVDSHAEHKDGRKYLRNEQDHARKQSYELRDELQEYYKTQRGTGLQPAETATGYEQAYQPTPAASSHHHKAHSTTSSKSLPPPIHYAASHSGQKRKSPSSPLSHGSSAPASKHRNYWKKDRETGRYHHKHIDGTISWLDEEVERE